MAVDRLWRAANLKHSIGTDPDEIRGELLRQHAYVAERLRRHYDVLNDQARRMLARAAFALLIDARQA